MQSIMERKSEYLVGYGIGAVFTAAFLGSYYGKFIIATYTFLGMGIAAILLGGILGSLAKR